MVAPETGLAACQELDKRTATLNDARTKVQSSAMNAEGQAAIDAADMALQKGQAAKDSAIDELNAFASRGSVVWQALLTIDAQADSTSKTLVITLSDAKTAMTGAAGAPTLAQFSGTHPQVKAANAQSDIDSLKGATSALTIYANMVSTQKYFTPLIAKINACPTSALTVSVTPN